MFRHGLADLYGIIKETWMVGAAAVPCRGRRTAAAGIERVNLFPIHQFMGKEYNALASFVWAAARTTGSYNR